jgi:LPXTG-motif cell wall-anchored protein
LYTGNTLVYRDGLDYTTNVIRGIANPYKDDYNYVDAAFFGNFGEEDMENIFNAILDSVQSTTRYDFLLKSGTNVVITDPLGDGMVVKGAPMLNFFGKNYSATGMSTARANGKTYYTYSWSGITAYRQTSDAKTKEEDTSIDLGGISLIVEEDNTTGAQIVTLSIAESALPTFYPDNYEQFYYEELPVRAIFRVGLSTAEETKLVTDANGRSIRDKTYYTNKYDADSGTAGATVTFQPADGNPYYTDTGNKSSSIAKSENTSGTTSTYFTESVNTDGTVTQQLGNNGKLVLNKLNKSDITVEKKWEAKAPAERVSVELYATCEKTYVPTKYTSYSNVRVDTVELNAANNWKYTWNNIDMDWSEGNYNYKYTNFYVREVPMNGYAASYQDKNGDDLQLQEVAYTETDMSKYVVVTPPTTDEEEAEEAEEAEETESAESLKLSAHSAGMWGFTAYVDAVAAGNGSTVTITNKDAYMLPNSGGTGTTMFTLSGLAVMFAATGLMYINKRRKSEQDNREAKY